MSRTWGAALLAVAACSGSGSTPDARPRALLGGTAADSPWPSDALVHHAGALGLDGRDDALAALAAALDENDGAPMRTSVFFPLDKDALADGPLAAQAKILDLTDPSAAPESWPLFYRKDTRELAAMAPVTRAFRPGHTYACVVPDDVVAPSDTMAAALRGEGPFASVYAPLAGKAAGAATVFTVGHPTRLLHAMRAAADAMPAPAAKVTRTLKTQPELDDFFGAPDTTRSGLGDPKGIVHDAIGAVVLGTFDAPYFIDAADGALGRIALAPDGAPIAKRTTPIPFLLTVPKSGTRFPVLIYQHGLNAGRWQVAAVANDYARAGFATIGVDALWHGERRPGAKDEAHDLSGAPGPDGLADRDDLGASFVFFDFGGQPGVPAMEARVVRDNFRQAVLEVTELVRLLVHGDTSALGFALDASHLVYTSESFGSVLGAQVLAVSPDLGAAVLSVGGAGIFLSVFPDSPFFQPVAPLFIRPAFDGALDFSDPARLPAEAQRSVSLMQAALEPGEPVAFAPEIAPKALLLLQAFSDELIPNQGGELLATAAGATSVEIPGFTHALRFATDLPRAPAPWRGQIAHVQVDRATHTMFTSFTAQQQYAVGFPPATKLDPPLTIDEPIEKLHAVAVAFARAYAAGTPEVSAP